MTQTVERMLPLYEAKMIHHFDHRWATYEPDGSIRDLSSDEKGDPSFTPLPRYWVREGVVADRLGPDKTLLGIRDVTNSTNERTVICSLFPRSAVGNNLPIMLNVSEEHRLRLVAYLSSFALDFVARPKVGGMHLNFFIANQLAVLPPDRLSTAVAWCADLGRWIDARVLWLVSHGHDLADSLGVDPVPFSRDARGLVRAELDAAMFHLLEIKRDEVDYIMETFPIVKRKDVAASGSYRTKELILEVYDAIQTAIASTTPYASPFDAVLDAPNA